MFAITFVDENCMMYYMVLMGEQHMCFVCKYTKGVYVFFIFFLFIVLENKNDFNTLMV